MTSAADKPILVLIHGWGLGSGVWQPARAAIEQRFHVVPINLPGYKPPETPVDKGSSQTDSQKPHEQTASGKASRRTPFDAVSSPSPRQYPSFLQTAEALAESVPEGCHLCGWSLGGLLAMQVAALAPQRIKRLIIVGGTPSFTQRADWPHAQPAGLLSLFSTAVAQDAEAALQRFAALLNQGDTQARMIGRTLLKPLLDAPLPDTVTLLAGLDWLRDVDLRPQLARITMPTQLIHGENDPLMPLPAVRWLQENLPDARLDIMPGAAHAPFLNDSEGFAARLGDY